MPTGKENIPTLVTVLRTAAAEVTGREVSGMIKSDKLQRSLPGAKSMTLMDSRARTAMLYSFVTVYIYLIPYWRVVEDLNP